MYWSYSIQTGIICNADNEHEAVATAIAYPNDIVFIAELVEANI